MEIDQNKYFKANKEKKGLNAQINLSLQADNSCLQ